MLVTDALNTMFERVNITKYKVSKLLGHDGAYVTNLINRKYDLRTSTVSSVAGCAGYALALVPNDHLSDDFIIIDAQ